MKYRRLGIAKDSFPKKCSILEGLLPGPPLMKLKDG